MGNSPTSDAAAPAYSAYSSSGAGFNNGSSYTPAPNGSPFATTQPTRRPPPAEQPPSYSPPANDAAILGPMQTTEDSQYAFLTAFDTVFCIDDSGSMAGRYWRETCDALMAITPICTAHDPNGIDIYFLNANSNSNGKLRALSNDRFQTNGIGGFVNVSKTQDVKTIFEAVAPWGGTPTGTRLNNILKPYVEELERSIEAPNAFPTPRPLNIIVITDGVPSDDPESVIVKFAKKLDALGAEPWQVGIQFFQVGNEIEAARDLKDLDDALAEKRGIRDMVDTVPWSGDDGRTLSADGILKVSLLDKHCWILG